MMQRNNPEKLKFFLYSVIALIFISITAVFLNYRFMSDDSDILNTYAEKPTLSLDKVQHVATKDGARQWSLDAAVVNYYQKQKKAVFSKVAVLFFSDKEKEIKLDAETGELATDTNDIVASGNVVVTYEDYVLKTDKLHFDNEKRVVRSKTPVEITSGKSVVTADKMEAGLDNGITVLEGNVKGIFHDNFNSKNND